MRSTSLFRHCLPYLLFAVSLSTTPQVAAQNNYDLGSINPGEILLNLNANEQIDVEQDTLHASLNYATQGRDRVALQSEVNRAMAGALALLAEGEVEYSTQQYQVYQVQVGRPSRADIENPVWRAQQGVQLTSQDSTALLDLAGKLQGMGLTMESLSYSLSPTRYEEVADSLMEAALTKLRSRAEAAAATLGKRGAELVEVTLNGSSNYFNPQMYSMEMRADAAADMPAPVAEPGMTTVTLSVSARAVLLP